MRLYCAVIGQIGFLLVAITKPVLAYGFKNLNHVQAGSHQIILNKPGADSGFGVNEPFLPTPQHLLPEKKSFLYDHDKHYYERFVNGSADGLYRRSSCPAINTLANRGFLNRDGRNISYSEFAHAVREVWNFGDDNVCLLSTTLELILMSRH